MTDQGLARRLAEFERRLRGLERGDRLTRSSIVVDDTGRSVTVTNAVVAGSREASLQAARAILPLLPVGDGIPRSLWFTDEPPVDGVALDLWLRPDNMVTQHDGTTWLELIDQTPAWPIAQLRSAIATDDGRVVAWSSAVAPAGLPLPAFGDLWLQADTVAYRWEGDAGWQPLVVAEGQSLNYVDGENGWAITPDGDSQFKDVRSLGTVAGAVLSGETMQLGGTDLQTILDRYPRGVIRAVSKGGTGQVGSGNITSTTEARLMTLSVGDVYADRLYRISFQGHLAVTAVDTSWTLTLRATLDGTEPTTTSPTVVSRHRKLRGVVNDDFSYWTEFIPATDGDLSLAMLGALSTGAGNAYIYHQDAFYKFRWIVEDIGPASAYDNNALSQKLKTDGSGEDNPPITRRTKTFQALWAWGVDTAGNMIYDSYISTGNNAFGAVGTYGLVGFDSAAIVGGLLGVVTPVSLTLRYVPRTRSTAAGLDLRILSHNYASRAAAQAAISWPEDYTSPGTLTSHGTVGNTVPATVSSFALGTTVFNQFKAGTKKGVGFANSATDPYASHPDGTGSVYGNGTSECQLVFVYDGTS